MCGANRISFGMQDFDPNVQRRVNRIQPAELFKQILTKKVRELYKTIAFDLLIGQPGQTPETMAKTCDQIVELQPTLVQLSLMAYKPWVAKYQIKMLAEGPLPDFLERKDPLQARRVSAIWVGALKKWLPGFEKATRIKFSPVVIQGDLDETVDWRYNLSVIRQKFADPQIHMLPGARQRAKG